MYIYLCARCVRVNTLIIFCTTIQRKQITDGFCIGLWAYYCRTCRYQYAKRNPNNAALAIIISR